MKRNVAIAMSEVPEWNAKKPDAGRSGAKAPMVTTTASKTIRTFRIHLKETAKVASFI